MISPDTLYPDDPEAAWLDDRLEAFLDGALPPDEAARVAALLDADDGAVAALDLSVAIRDGLRQLPTLACPPEVTRVVLGHARRAARRTWRRRLSDTWNGLWAAYTRPALAMATLLLVVVSAARIGAPPAPAAPSDEVAAALAEVQWTLAFLSEVGRDTGAAVRHDVLEARLVEPMQRALGRAISEPRPSSNP